MPARIDQAFRNLSAPAAPGPPAVSIVTPFFNMTALVEETAESVFRQTFRDFEWIIVDDGSTDSAATPLLRRLEERDPRVRVVRQANRGLAAARNRGFAEARAKYVAQVDADDLLEPTFVEKCLWFLETHPHCGWAYTGAVIFGDEESRWMKEFRADVLPQANFFVEQAMIRRRVHEAVGGYDEGFQRGFEDWDYWLTLVEQGHTTQLIPEYLCRYRRRAGSMLARIDADVKLSRRLRAELRRKHAALYKNGPPPAPSPPWPAPYPWINDHLPFVNLRAEGDPRVGVLFVWPWTAMGGSDKFNLDLLRGLDPAAFRPHVVTTVKSDNAWAERFLALTPEVFHLPNFLPLEDWLRFLVYFIRSRRISLVFVSNSEFGYLSAPVLNRLFPRLKLVDFVHMEEMEWRGGGHAYASAAAGPALDRSLVSSHHLGRRYTEEFGRSPERVGVVHTNVDAEGEFNPDRYPYGTLREEAGCKRDTPVLLFVGRMYAQKRPDLLLRVLSRLRSATPVPFQAWIVGDGPDLADTRRLARELDLGETCIFWGAREDVGQFYREADLLVLPSRWEGIAVTIYEAMAMGVPVVASDVGGQRELVTPATGVLVSPGGEELEGFVRAIAGLLEDPGERRSRGIAARERVRREFPLAGMVSAVTQHLVEVLAQEDADRVAAYWPLALDRYSQWLETQRLEPASRRLRQELSTQPAPRETPSGAEHLTPREVLVVNVVVEQLIWRLYRSRAWRAVTTRPWLKRRLLRLVGLRGPEERVPTDQ